MKRRLCLKIFSDPDGWMSEACEGCGYWVFHGVLDAWGEVGRGVVSWELQGVGVIISHYPQGRRLCSPVTPGFIELATLQ